MKLDNMQEVSKEIHRTAAEKGFWGPVVDMDKYVAKLALVHSEITEVLEALRKEKGPDAVTEEVADVIIRLLDVFEVLAEKNLATRDLSQVILDKMIANSNRPPKHSWSWG